MKLSEIPLKNILPGERFRKDYGNLSELAQSIKENGLIQPIAIIGTKPPYTLAAGGRRYNACKLLKMETVPCRIFDHQLNELELRTIECEENLQRKDMTWQEQVSLEMEIHNLQVELKGEKTSTSPEGHSLRDTAKMTGRSPASLSLDLRLAKAMTDMPDLDWEDCKNKKEAKRLLTKIDKVVERKEKVEEAKRQIGSGNNAIKRIISSYIVEDFLTTPLNENTFHFAEIDPPYAIDLQKIKRDYNYDSYNEVPSDTYLDFMRQVLERTYIALKPDAFLILWFAPEPWFEHMFQLLTSVGFITTRMCGIWNKSFGQTNSPDFHLANAYEMFFIARKGNATIKRPGTPNIFSCKPVPPQLKGHPTQRPDELMTQLIETFTLPNDRILVPFAGSGTTIKNAYRSDRIAIGYDLSPEYKEYFTKTVMEEL